MGYSHTGLQVDEIMRPCREQHGKRGVEDWSSSWKGKMVRRCPPLMRQLAPSRLSTERRLPWTPLHRAPSRRSASLTVSAAAASFIVTHPARHSRPARRHHGIIIGGGDDDDAPRRASRGSGVEAIR